MSQPSQAWTTPWPGRVSPEITITRSRAWKRYPNAYFQLAWGTANGEHPSTLALVGVACAIAAGGLIARERSQAVEVHPGRELALAVSAGVGFGVSFIFYSETSKHAGFWPVLTGRGVALPLALLAVLVVRPRLVARPSLAVGRRGRTLAAAAGFLDVSATALLLVAFREGLTSLVAPIAALAPAFTVALAWLVLSEPIARLQMAGLLLALLGLSFIAAG